ncbi:MAG: cupin domain-containing protein [Blastocatellales bacterium]|nr:cupin domain-containing protein [Blastocatellales bacterium]
MQINNREKSRVLNTPHGSEIRPLVDRTNSAVSQCSLAEELLPPGCSVSLHHHRVIEEIYYILEGEGVMRIDNEQSQVAAGDAVYIPRNSRHTLTNTGAGVMRLLLVCGPAYFQEDHRSE